MNSGDFQKAEENNDKDRSVSTSSFYKLGTKPKYNPKQHPQLLHAIELQQRETHEQIEKLNLALDLKAEYIGKRSAESLEQSKKIMEEVVEAERHLQESLKNVQKSDKTKQWAVEMEKTIQGIMQNNKEIEDKVVQKNASQCRDINARCEEAEERLRSEKKEREREWEAMIDNVGNSILQTEALIQGEREAMEDKMLELERQILDMQELSISLMNGEAQSRKQEHEYLSKLIERIMDKLIF